MTPELLLPLLAGSAVLPFTDSRALAGLAELVLGQGIEGPGLVQLAILGTEPFGARDARELAKEALKDLGAAEMFIPDAGGFAGALAARALGDGSHPRSRLDPLCLPARDGDDPHRVRTFSWSLVASRWQAAPVLVVGRACVVVLMVGSPATARTQ
jgi:hypothetical protein